MDTFCVLPWYSLESPANTPCCLLPKNTNIDQLKADLLAGVRSAACNKCWKLEDQGKQSRRQQENMFLDYKLDRDLDKINQDCINNKNSVLIYQIKTSNLCNQACVSCSSTFSTKWAELERNMELSATPYTITNFQQFDINYNTARKITLLGGEPLFDPQTFKILNELILAGNTDCFISLVTNGSIKLSKAQVEILSQFSNLNICVSIDGIGPVFEYLRWPAKWPALLENIEQYKSIAEDVSVSYTISSLNVMYYDETIAWFKENNLNYNHNIVSQPAWLAVSNTPNVLRNNNFVNSFCSTNVSIDNMLVQIAKQDQIKKININDYMPEVAKLLGMH
jgi:hypothetical protein